MDLLIGPPPVHAAAAMLLTGLMFYAFVVGKLKTEIICLLMLSVIALGLYLFPMPGQAPTDGLKLAFEGFGHYALITICALMILGRGLVVTGALEPLVQQLTRVWRFNRYVGLLVTLVMAMLMSMFVNDTPVLVLLLPILVALATRGGMPASRTLIPVNSAVLIGGMATTIGTSTNLLVVSIAGDLGMPPMSVFYFTPLVIMAAAVALPFMWLVMPRLLPDNSPEAGHSPRLFRAVLRLKDTSPAIGKTLADALGEAAAGIRIIAAPQGLLQAYDRIIISASHDDIEALIQQLRATSAPPEMLERLNVRSGEIGEDLAIVELSVARDSGLIGRLVTNSGVATSHDVVVIAVHHVRPDWTEPAPTAGEPVLAVGDIILATGTLSDVARLARDEGLLMLEGFREVPRTAKAPLALAIMAGSVALASFGIVPIAISALGGAIMMFVTGCVRFERVGRALSANVIVLVAASIAVGRVILESGAAAWLAELLALGLIYLPTGAVLAAVMVFVTLLTNFASNTTAAAVGTPIAFSLAEALGTPVEPLVLAVLFGCNLCYATPVAYQTNMMIMSAGDYKFGDYTRTGVPLVAIMIVTLSGLLVWRYGLY